jgi:hypothetical protein
MVAKCRGCGKINKKSTLQIIKGFKMPVYILAKLNIR